MYPMRPFSPYNPPYQPYNRRNPSFPIDRHQRQWPSNSSAEGSPPENGAPNKILERAIIGFNMGFLLSFMKIQTTSFISPSAGKNIASFHLIAPFACMTIGALLGAGEEYLEEGKRFEAGKYLTASALGTAFLIHEFFLSSSILDFNAFWK